MAALHSALKTLAPVEFSSIPTGDVESYLQDAFAKSQMLIDSVPPPDSDSSLALARSRSNTLSSSTSSGSEISISTARSMPVVPEHAALQKEWGKPIKLAPKDNPLGISVFKLPGKDGKGSWFARRSVHEGLPFHKWKKALEKEFPETMNVQGGPGEGNIRGIGAERLIEKKHVDEVGNLEVYHLSAQFPGPTAPRDFVTLLLTSSSAFDDSSTPDLKSSSTSSNPNAPPPRHYMVISKPCLHQECPPRDGFIRGEYESIEFIREIPIKPPPTPKKRRSRANSANMSREALLRHAEQNGTTPFPDLKTEDDAEGPFKLNGSNSTLSLPERRQSESKGRARSKTISFAPVIKVDGPQGESAPPVDTSGQEHEADSNPVEWIMITRSDPGGSVPRWMVERGTPGGIVSDAGKFLQWAINQDHTDEQEEAEGDEEQPVEQPPTNSTADASATNGDAVAKALQNVPEADAVQEAPGPESSGIISSVTHAVGAGLSAVTPAVFMKSSDPSQQDQPGAPPTVGTSSQSAPANFEDDDTSETSSIASYATASSGYSSKGDGTTTSSHTAPSVTKNALAAQERELQKLNARKTRLDERLSKTRLANSARSSEMSEKEAAAIAKAEEKHAREVKKHEERYAREVAKIEAKRLKESKKLAERKQRESERDERVKWAREKEELETRVKTLEKERDDLRGLVGDVQRQNTALAAKLGTVTGMAHHDLLNAVNSSTDTLSGRSRGTSTSSNGNWGHRSVKSAIDTPASSTNLPGLVDKGAVPVK